MVKFIYTFFFLFSYGYLWAQADLTDTIFTLPETNIFSSRLQDFTLAQRLDTLGKKYKKINPQHNLGQALRQQSSVYIKDYGPGRLATTSMRGGSSTQTAVVWNGFNLQSPMLGQIDFSLLPIFFTDQVTVQYGSSSSLWGSGAIGGAIILANRSAYDQGLQIDWTSQVGSFGQFQNGLALGFSTKKITTKTSVFYHVAENDFPFLTENGDAKKLSHSQFEYWGVQQENRLAIGNNQQINFTSWYQEADREIPPTIFQQTSVARQKDRQWRNSLEWKYFQQKSNLSVRAGWFYEQFQYQDSIANIDGNSSAWTYSAAADYQYQIHPQHKFEVGLNFNYIQAQAKNYLDQPTEKRAALFLAYQWQSRKKNWRISTNIRKEWVNQRVGPLVPSLAFETKILPTLFLSGNVNASYRLPSFDDLYWSPGGNRDLLPEEAWSQSLALRLQKKQYSLSLTGFNRQVKNWIIWLPQGPFWSPQNLLEVWSRGFDAKAQVGFSLGDFHANIDLSYELVLSTNQKGKTENDPSVEQQLIYVPLHKAFTNIQLRYQHWNISLYQNYTGLVYTLADNSESLDAYFLQDFVLQRSLIFKQHRWEIFAKVKNLWDQNYVVVAAQAMPGRNYEFGIHFKFNHKNN